MMFLKMKKDLQKKVIWVQSSEPKLLAWMLEDFRENLRVQEDVRRQLQCDLNRLNQSP